MYDKSLAPYLLDIASVVLAVSWSPTVTQRVSPGFLIQWAAVRMCLQAGRQVNDVIINITFMGITIITTIINSKQYSIIIINAIVFIIATIIYIIVNRPRRCKGLL